MTAWLFTITLFIIHVHVQGFQTIDNTVIHGPLRHRRCYILKQLHASLSLNEPPTILRGGTLADDKVTTELPPVLQDIVDERREFEMNLGKAMDTLRNDYPDILHQSPDFSIYNEDIRVVDPSGVQLSGLNSYKGSFAFLQPLVKFFYNMECSNVQSRMMYDFARQSIRITWNAMLVPKVIGNSRNALYIDGISIYKMDSISGKIAEHRVESMTINDIPVSPPYGVLTALKNEILHPSSRRSPVGAGVGVGAMIELS